MTTRIRKRLRTILHRARYERELDLELQFHVDMLTAQHLRSGLPPALARRAAMRAFGPVAGVKDDVRDTWLAGMVESAVQDVRYGGRTLATAPAFALGMILTIALAIGVNTSIFGIAYALLLRPLPFDAPADLVVLQHGTPALTRITFSPPELDDYRGTSGFDITYRAERLTVLDHYGETVRPFWDQRKRLAHSGVRRHRDRRVVDRM